MNEDFVVDSYEHAGLTVKIVADQDTSSIYDPREMDQLGVLYCWHPDYVLGDEQFTHEDHPERGMEDIGRWLMNERQALFVIPLYLLDHSGISMSSGPTIWPQDDVPDPRSTRTHNACDPGGWDTTMVGFAYTTAERALELGIPGTAKVGDSYRVTNDAKMREEAERQVKGEVEEYDLYLTGDCGGYVIEDEDEEHLDSCWGFLGLNRDYVKEEANAAAEGCREEIEREQREAAEWAARDVVTTT